MVHDSVHPIKIGVVHEEHYRKDSPKIDRAIFIDISIQGCVLSNILIVNENHRYSTKDGDC
jgi:hypothetical protein